MSKIKFFSLILALFLLVSCAPSADAIATSVAQTVAADSAETQAAVARTKISISQTQTSAPTKTSTNTELPPTPTFTLTSTFTPLPSFTATITLTPIPLSSFLPLTFVDDFRSSPNNYVGKYLKALAYVGSDPAYKWWLAPADYSPRGVYVTLTVDVNANLLSSQLDSSRWIWIYGIIKKTDNDLPLISVVHIELFPSDQAPREDGIYKVGDDIASGRWKSMSDAIDTQSCYWARIASNGSIIDNFFGYGGTTIYINSSDYAVEFSKCGTMVYLGK
jgi:hypothetical protein